ncbi:MAG: hypothetical protein HY586_08015, partial [Candidatus Omnitrophica bacterium]|nr:hypothetical protein [Candidatus Omnitrophota bacterium]
EDLHTLSVFINGHSVKDDIVQMRDVLVFNVKDPYVMQREYTGKWVGVIRPLLGWQTTRLDS